MHHHKCLSAEGQQRQWMRGLEEADFLFHVVRYFPPNLSHIQLSPTFPKSPSWWFCHPWKLSALSPHPQNVHVLVTVTLEEAAYWSGAKGILKRRQFEKASSNGCSLFHSHSCDFKKRIIKGGKDIPWLPIEIWNKSKEKREWEKHNQFSFIWHTLLWILKPTDALLRLNLQALQEAKC